jgi:hypothetical protein
MHLTACNGYYTIDAQPHMSRTAHILTDDADIAKELKGIAHFELILVYEGVRGQRKEPTKALSPNFPTVDLPNWEVRAGR